MHYTATEGRCLKNNKNTYPNRKYKARKQIRQGQILISSHTHTHTHTHTHAQTCPFNGPLSGTTRVSWYQKGKTNLDFTEARDSEWQWHQLGYMQVCTSLQTDNHASTRPLSFLQAGCPSCCPINNVKALKAVKSKKKVPAHSTQSKLKKSPNNANTNSD